MLEGLGGQLLACRCALDLRRLALQEADLLLHPSRHFAVQLRLQLQQPNLNSIFLRLLAAELQQKALLSDRSVEITSCLDLSQLGLKLLGRNDFSFKLPGIRVAVLVSCLHDRHMDPQLFSFAAASIDLSLDLLAFILYTSGLFERFVATLQLLVGFHDTKDAKLLRLKNCKTSGA